MLGVNGVRNLRNFVLDIWVWNDIPNYIMDHTQGKNSDSDKPNVDTSTINDFDKLLDLVRVDANLIDGLTDEQVTELRKKISPYGRTVEGKGSFTCISVTNLAEQYMKKFLMTSLIGFLYRQCDEYDLDDGEPTCSLDNYAVYMSKYKQATDAAHESSTWLDNFWSATHNKGLTEETLSLEQRAERLTHQRILERGEGFKKRLIVRQFLDGLFQFNPDAHVRSAYSYNPLDPERVKPAHVDIKGTKKTKKTKTLVGKSGAKMTVSRSTEPEGKPDERFPFIESDAPGDRELMKDSAPEPPVETAGTLPTSKIIENDSPEDRVHKRAYNPLVRHIPPADVFHRWTYYTDSNYEEVRTAVQDLYADKPDLEFAINPYAQFDNEADAGNFVQKHKNEVITDILTLHNSKWNLTGSFKKNRERVNFYSEKTAVIEEIFKQLEQDKKLGADLMRKRVKRKKKKNVQESGPDPVEFKQYRKDHPSSFESMGAEDVSRSEIKSPDDTTFKIHEECPYDAVQVDVFDFRGGGQSVKKSEFFTEAEDPVQLDEPSK